MAKLAPGRRLLNYFRSLAFDESRRTIEAFDDKASAEDICAGLQVASKKLLGSDLLPKDLLPATPEQDERARVRLKSRACNESW
jgi:hypothetical protein